MSAPEPEAPTIAAGDTVRLINSHGRPAVGIIHGGRRLYVANRTRAKVLIPGPREWVDGVPVYDVEITEGPHRGKRVAVHAAAVELVSPPRQSWLRSLIKGAS
jgi:hypothetical protein